MKMRDRYGWPVEQITGNPITNYIRLLLNLEAPPNGNVQDSARKAMSQTEQQPNSWKDAIIEELICYHILSSLNENDPKRAVSDLPPVRK